MAPRFHLLGAELFIDWVPGDGPTEEDCKKFRKPTLREEMSEHAMYPELADAVQSVLEAAGCDVLRFLNMANHKAKSGKRDPDGIYMNSPLAREAIEFTSEHHEPRSTMTPELDILFELKTSEEFAAFYFKTKPRGYKDAGGEQGETATADLLARDDAAAGARDGESSAKPETTTRTVPPFAKVSKRGEVALAQFIEYMHNVRKCQHRIFSYAVYVCYDMARLFYFDRSGAFVSEPFRWDAKDSLMHQFVWKIAKLANAGRFEDLGRDPTAELVSCKLKDKFIALKDDTHLPPHVRDGFQKATADNCPIYQLEVMPGEPSKEEWFPDESFPPPKESSSPSTGPDPSSSTPVSRPSSSSGPLPGSVRRFLVGRPHFAADALVGRCTTGYYAYDVTDADEKKWRVCFLKDSWRAVVPGRTRPEHLLYERFRHHGVTAAHGIGTLICGGDVGGRWAQRTRVQEHLPQANRPVLVHYRIVIEEIGVPLEDFRSFPELSGIFSDAMAAHYKVWSSAKVLHRDVSVGNIMIRIQPDGMREGFLIDWDLSRLECELGTGPVEPDRTGMWQFHSALSLLYPWKPYRVSDDIESFVHAYIYLVLRYHVTDIGSLSELVVTLFEGVSLVQGIEVGGDRKLSLFRSVKLPFTIETNPDLENLLQNIIVRCTDSYNRIDLAEMERRYGFGPDDKKTAPAAPPPPIVKTNVKRRKALRLDIPCADPHDPAFVKAALGFRLPAGPRREADPCVMTGFLSMQGGLVRLFDAHADCDLGRIDKDVDQFLARRHEDVYQGTNDPRNCLGSSMSTSGTFVSGHTGMSELSNSSGLVASSFASIRNQGQSRSTGGTSLDSKKRVRAEDEDSADSEAAAGSNGEEPLSKRVKKVVGRKL